jgi:two-component system phosphate regulon response regulator PhoB
VGAVATAIEERTSVLVVEDEPDLQALLTFNLTDAGFDVAAASRGGEAFVRARESRPAVVLLDLQLPDVSGIDVCRMLRADPILRGTAVLMLTARGSEEDRVAGFDAGADDYVVKPFLVRELVLRVRALVHRVAPLAAPSSSRSVASLTNTLAVGGIEVDPVRHRVTVEGHEVELRPLEYKLLLALLADGQRVVSREGSERRDEDARRDHPPAPHPARPTRTPRRDRAPRGIPPAALSASRLFASGDATGTEHVF